MLRCVGIILAAAISFMAAEPAAAQSGKRSDDPAPHANSKMRIEGNRLIYDTENVPDDVETSIESDDVDPFLKLLQENDGITLVELNSTGGSHWASRRMADIIIDFGLDTEVNGECASSCARVFLGGKNRRMTTGSRMGFHQFWWGPRDVKSYYDRNAASEGWDSPFEFGSWIYTDTQSELHEHLSFMIQRGVDPVFAIQTLSASPDEMWNPYRIRLRTANVLTE